MPESDKTPPDEISKSTIKREMNKLQKLGEALVELPLPQLKKIPLPDELLEAILFVHTLKSRESKRRQLQYIGKLMRNTDVEPIQSAFKHIQLSNSRATEKFHEIEKWRERLVTEGDEALHEFVTLHEKADRQELRKLIRVVQHNRKMAKNTGAETALFRYLKDVLS